MNVMNNRENYTLFVREHKYEEERSTCIYFKIDYSSKDRQYVREIDDTLAVLSERLNSGGEEELKRLLRVIDAYLEGVTSNACCD